MNELQITLLIIAAVFLAGLYFLHLKKKKETHSEQNASQADPLQAQNTTQEKLLADAHTQSTTPEKGGLKEEDGRLVLEIDEPMELTPVSQEAFEGVQSNFGRPAEQTEEEILVGEEAATREPQLFAIMVIGTRTYGFQEIRTALLAIGMTYDEKEQIFVRKNDQGKIYLRAANALDPGTFPAEHDEAFATPGIALILQLPTCIHAPPAMDQMIRDARKLSQRLGAHLYNMDRSRISEPDLKKMRDAALNYVSVPLK